MPVFRIERTRDYTVMSNHHLKNPDLSLKAKGLLSMMLSFPDGWNYSERGLASICKEGVDDMVLPDAAPPDAAAPEPENPGELNNKKPNTKKQILTGTIIISAK